MPEPVASLPSAATPGRILAHLPGVDGDPAVARVLDALDRAQRAGHTCLPLDELGAEAARSVEALRRTGLLAEGAADHRPLVLSDDLLWSRRYWRYEHGLALALRERAGRVCTVDAQVAADLEAGLPVDPAALIGGIDHQRLAAAAALTAGLALITGGPGTGKTRVAGLIVACLAQRHARTGAADPLRVLAAAPTGKAAQGLQESLAAASGAETSSAATLHRLLFDRRIADCDLLVIDEVSMADAATLARVLARLAPAARLLLLGDPDQLASVEAGRILGDLAEHELDAVTPDAAALYRAAGGSGEPATAERAGADPLGLVQVRLQKNWRSAEAPAIATLAAAVRDGPAAVATALHEATGTHCQRRDLPPPAKLYTQLWEERQQRIRAVVDAPDPAAALAGISAWRILCAMRRGPYGAEAVDRALGARLEAAGHPVRPDGHYHGRPIMITRNDHDLGLYNGDVGVIRLDSAPPAVCFNDPAGGPPRRVGLHRLGAVAGAWALTVHKAQGSEFDAVDLVLLDPAAAGGGARLLTRELLYTGITRTRSELVLHGDPACLSGAAATRSERRSGFGRILAGPFGPG